MKRYGQLSLVGILTLALFVSCATPLKKSTALRPIQKMGEPGVMVISIDAQREAELLSPLFEEIGSFASRINRISIALQPTSDDYPVDPTQMSWWAVIEGDFPRFLTNTALIYVPGFRRFESEDGRTYFMQKDGSLSVRAMGNNSLLVSTEVWQSSYDRYRSATLLIEDEVADLMESSSIALWAAEPRTFFELGLELPEQTFSHAQSTLFLLNRDYDDQYWVDAYITMKEPKEANTLSQMIRSGYVARLRREKQAVNIAALREMFLLEDLQVIIRQMGLQENELAQLKESLVGIF